MFDVIIQLAPYLVSAGAGIAWLAMVKHRSASYTKQVQEIYEQFVKDTAVEIGQLKEEIKMLRKVVESYKETCDACPNNQKKKL